MSTKSAPFYWIECDEPGCESRTPGGYDDVMAYMDIGQVIDDAECSEWSIDHNETGKDYCPEHVPDIGPGDEA